MRALSVALVASYLLAACGHHSDSGAERLVLTGSSTIAPLAADLGHRYEQLHPGVRIDVQSGGSSRGVSDVQSGTAGLGMVSRSLKPEDGPLLSTIIAKDGIAVIVHAQNQLRDVTKAQLASIYTKRSQTWVDLGGPNRPIIVVNKAAGRSTLELFLHYVALEPDAIKADVIAGENEQVIKTVAGNPDAVGYVSIGTALSDIQEGVAIKMLRLDGVMPTLEAVRDGSYPLSRPLNVVYRVPPTGLSKDFLEFARSGAGQAAVAKFQFVTP
jgi:phosphate transport system substrate-binding protein